MGEICSEEGAGVFFAPYRVVATGGGKGVIEVVPNSASRDAVGKLVDGGLDVYFAEKFGGGGISQS